MTQTVGEILEGHGEIKGQDNCQRCSKPFTYTAHSLFPGLRYFNCLACQAILMAENEADLKRQNEALRMQSWLELCPPAFQATDRSKLPLTAKYDEVMAWEYGPIGLTLHGDTGKGKSRCAWELVKREFLSGRTVKVFNSMGGMKFAATYSVSAENAEQLANGLISANILFLDDPFKVKLTESTEAMLFSVINERMERLLPVITTMNDTPSTLTERMTGDRAQPLIRRLREFTRAVKF